MKDRVATALLCLTSALGACVSPPPRPAEDSAMEPPARPVPQRPAAPPAEDVAPPSPDLPPLPYARQVEIVHRAARTTAEPYQRLTHLTDVIGPRLAGSAGLERAVEWMAATMRADGLDVRLQEVMVPTWVRGTESATLLTPREAPLAMLGLGNSVGTPPGGISAEVVVARDFDELAALGDAVKGRIVLFDAAMPPYDPAQGAGYGQTVVYRTAGASRAAAAGAVACLVRSVTATSLDTPHTGMLRYEDGKPRIPAAALTTEDADMIRRLVEAGESVTVRLSMQAHFEDDAPSANVIGELVGTEFPDEVVLLAAHLDSWDVGGGAQDDGGGCIAVTSALKLIKEEFGPLRRTVRVVLFTNEENGLRGGREYARGHAEETPRYQAAIEADSGTFRPLGFSTAAAKDERTGRIRRRLAAVLRHLEPYGSGRLSDGGGGADIGPLGAFGVPLLGLRVEGSRYFDVHHTRADTLDKVHPDDLADCVATLASMATILATMPERLDAPE